MKTVRRPVARAAGTAAARVAVLATTVALALSGCSAPSLDARVAELSRPDGCERALARASRLTSSSTGPGTLAMRYLAADGARSAWLDVAAACPARVDQASLRSAQAGWTAAGLADAVAMPTPSPDAVDFDPVGRLALPADAVASMAVAEDRAGFAVEVLAARGVPDATLAMSDDHKAAGQRLLSLSGESHDPRRKVYSVDALLGDGTVRDGATGLSVPVVAAVEMDCARGYLDALRGGADDGGAVESSPRTLRLVAGTVASRAWRAFRLGYPDTDAVLFR